MKKAIVLGATGFIGSWLIKVLLENNVLVLALVENHSKLLPEFLSNENFRFCKCDYKDIQNTKITDFYDSDCFFDLGWGGVDSSEKNNSDLQISNIIDSMNAIRLAKRINSKLFIATGTVAEYVFSKDTINVHDQQTPNDMYGAAKVSTHYFLDVLSRQIDQPYIWALIPSTYGERRPGNNILTYTIISLLQDQTPKYGNLNQMWDFLYVYDVARALYKLGISGKNGKTYGIGSGIYKPLKEYIYIIRDIINPNAELGIGELPQMSKQTFSSCVNIDDLLKDTDYKASTTFEEGIKKTIDWYKEQLGKGENI
jgi:nucleoside-diphosphate-sugar epimerase